VTRTRVKEVAALLATADATPGERDERDLAAVLAVFNAAVPGAGDVGAQVQHAPRRPEWVTGRLVAKCAAAFVLATGCGVAAAGAGVLPTPVQQFAHDVLGDAGVPAPRTPGAAVTGGATATISAGGGSALPSSNASSTTLVALCTTAEQAGGSWRSAVSKADRATLAAAAGDEQNVLSYCAALLASSPTASAAPSAAASATASPDATDTRGSAHATHTPNPHSTAH